MSYRFTGAPEPEVAVAIIASIETVLGAPPPPPVGIPAWRGAGIRENVAPFPTAAPGVSWRAATAGP